MVKYLVSLGANIESADINHRTPLYIAVEYKRKKIVSFLLSVGANRDIVKLDGTKLRDLM
jgi:ankyrin repeat protein